MGQKLLVYLLRREVYVLGIDAPSIHGPSQKFAVHVLVFEKNVPALENEKLEKLPEVGSWIIAMPMKIDGGSGTGRFDHPRK